MEPTDITLNPIELDKPTVNKKPAARNPTLDVIRAIAILLVILSHLALIDDRVIIHSPFRYLQLALSFIRVGGWSGVDLFFVLSGFLVSGLLFKEYKKTRAIKATTFLIRRGFKIYPSFVFFLIFSGVVEFVLKAKFHKGAFQLTDYIKDLFFLHNYLGGRWATTWSLDVEEAFYFLLAGFFLLAIKFKKLSFKGLITTYTALVIFSITGRLIMNIRHPVYSFELHYSYSHLRLDALFFGVILSYLYHYHSEQLKAFFSKYKNVILPLAILMALPNFLFPREHNNWISVFLLSTNPVAYGALLMLALNSKATFLKNKH